MIDDRISKLARTNPIVHAGIRAFVDAGLSEKETLVRWRKWTDTQFVSSNNVLNKVNKE